MKPCARCNAALPNDAAECAACGSPLVGPPKAAPSPVAAPADSRGSQRWTPSLAEFCADLGWDPLFWAAIVLILLALLKAGLP